MKAFTLQGNEYSFLRPYIIAEVGVNHEGSLDRAKRMIEAAAGAGAHAVKFQTYKAEKLAARSTSPAYWDLREEAAESQFELFRRWDNFDADDYQALATHCASCGVHFMSTPFDLEAVDLLAPLVPAFKIASADVTNVPLLRKIGATGLPVIMSVGAARLDEVETAVAILGSSGAPQVSLLHCVLNYPTPPEHAQLAQIDVIARVFGDRCSIGYSDHVKPDADGAMPALDVAVLRGAVVLEKHFTDDKAAKGNDHYHAMDAADLAAFARRLDLLRTLYGSKIRDLSTEHRAIKNARRRILASRDLAPGQRLGPSDLVALRSTEGIEVAHWDEVVGRETSRAISALEPLEWSSLA